MKYFCREKILRIKEDNRNNIPLDYACKLLNLDINKHEDIIASALKDEMFFVLTPQYQCKWMITPYGLDILEKIATIKEDLEDKFEIDLREKIHEALNINVQFHFMDVAGANEN